MLHTAIPRDSGCGAEDGQGNAVFVFKEEDFYTNPKGEGVYLTRESLKRYFLQYERQINHEFTHPDTGENKTLRKCFRFQAEKLASHIRGGSPYTTFNLEV